VELSLREYLSERERDDREITKFHITNYCASFRLRCRPFLMICNVGRSSLI
jgi:hypothetical protein